MSPQKTKQPFDLVTQDDADATKDYSTAEIGEFIGSVNNTELPNTVEEIDFQENNTEEETNATGKKKYVYWSAFTALVAGIAVAAFMAGSKMKKSKASLPLSMLAVRRHLNLK